VTLQEIVRPPLGIEDRPADHLVATPWLKGERETQGPWIFEIFSHDRQGRPTSPVTLVRSGRRLPPGLPPIARPTASPCPIGPKPFRKPGGLLSQLPMFVPSGSKRFAHDWPAEASFRILRASLKRSSRRVFCDLGGPERAPQAPHAERWIDRTRLESLESPVEATGAFHEGTSPIDRASPAFRAILTSERSGGNTGPVGTTGGSSR
jgi:hypothetical protein